MQLNYIMENRIVFVSQVLLKFKNFVPKSWQIASVGRGKVLSVQTWQPHLDSQYPCEGEKEKNINPTMNLNYLAHFGLLKTKPRAFKLHFQTPEYKEMPQSYESTAILQGIFPTRQVGIPPSTVYVM